MQVTPNKIQIKLLKEQWYLQMVFSEQKHKCAPTEAVFVGIAMKGHLPLLISAE